MTDNAISENVDSDEEDYEIYFLQPASSPYNIKEKLEAANKELFESSPIVEKKLLKIKFKEDLVDYEPDLTDDDVQSIESYNEMEYLLEQELNQDVESQQPSNKIELNIFTPTLNVTEEDEEYEENDADDNEDTEKNDILDEDSLEQVKDFNMDSNGNSENRKSDTSSEGNIEEQLEERSEESDVNSYENNYSEEILDTSNTDSSFTNNTISDEEIEDIDDIIPTDETESKETITSSTTKTVTSTSSKKPLTVLGKRLSKVDCRAHCIERLDSELDLTISKLQINEKPLCPTLKLIKRRCCEENHAKIDQKLPCYSGLRSEYGLSMLQLEKRQKRKELTKIREEKRRRLVEEYKNRKIQQNEEIFSQWLKDIQRRKQEQTKKRENNKKIISPKILNIPNKCSEKLERPKTAYPLIPSHNIKKVKRPNTSTACVFIQVPRAVLKQGLAVGDIIVSNSKSSPTGKGLHVLSIS